MHGKFTLSIQLGNEAMETADDIATALEMVAGRLHDGCDAGSIHDVNGTKVGQFKAIYDEDHKS
jgi:hypothetical protein